jgi:REP element-mobilizing transposase RayT
MAQSYTNILVHIIFGTKHREPLLEKRILPSVLDFLAGGVKEQQGITLAINGVVDHVHILAKVRQDRTISDLLRDIKARSSGWIHRTYPELSSFAWQNGFGAFSVSQSQIEVVRQYIANQEEHHKTKPFAEEFVQFLVANEIEFNERYLWD